MNGDKVAKIVEFHPPVPVPVETAVCIFSVQSHGMINLNLSLRFHLNSAKLLRGKKKCSTNVAGVLITKPQLMTHSELFA